ncbi:hypothetical protein NDU88_006627 [Pleurodeles waltl]|uniref:Uncharacterized protein n=1 Tax=Pleurodeles waltl TaxID=8319 RepID=A0AAV7RM40_PLEWA|nr:hypothetical protein NDU88_006627 [Pleurodeles waltl]
MGGHSPLEQEDSGGPAGDGLPTWEGCSSHHDPLDITDPGGGVSGVGWALEGLTAATRRLLVGERLRQGGTGNRKKEEPAAAPIEVKESL